MSIPLSIILQPEYDLYLMLFENQIIFDRSDQLTTTLAGLNIAKRVYIGRSSAPLTFLSVLFGSPSLALSLHPGFAEFLISYRRHFPPELFLVVFCLTNSRIGPTLAL